MGHPSCGRVSLRIASLEIPEFLSLILFISYKYQAIEKGHPRGNRGMDKLTS